MPLSMLHVLKLIFHSLIIFLSILFAVYLLTQAHARRRINAWLAGFLLCRAVVSLGGWLEHFIDLGTIVFRGAPWLFYVDGPFALLAMPFLFFYVLALTRDDFKLRLRHLVHGIPALVDIIYLAVFLGTTPSEGLRNIIRAEESVPGTASLVLYIALQVQFFFYIAAAFAAVRSYRKRLKDLYAAMERINLSWLVLVLTGLTASKVFGLADYAAWIGGRPGLSIGLYIVEQVMFLAFISLMFLKALRQPTIFSGVPGKAAKTKYEKTLLAGPLREEYRDRLVRHMDEKKPYLNPLINLPDLAGQVRIPAHHLSQLLNACFRQNFFDFINAYRVRESQRLLVSEEAGTRTVLDILYETGFNSKSVFNTAFRKHVGMTPSEFKKAVESGARPRPD